MFITGNIQLGTYAEYVIVPERFVAPKPINLSMEEVSDVSLLSTECTECSHSQGRKRKGRQEREAQKEGEARWGIGNEKKGRGSDREEQVGVRAGGGEKVAGGKRRGERGVCLCVWVIG